MFRTNRRGFLVESLAGSALLSLSGPAPWILRQAAAAEADSSTRVLVVVQWTGGNDGLNTVIPTDDDLYYRQRPTLAIPRGDQRRLTDQLALPPALEGAERLWDQGQLAIVQGVGYDQPNRSHFESMDIWHTARRKSQSRQEGWLGRYLETLADTAAGDLPGLHLGYEEQPLALAAQRVRVPSVGSLDRFRLTPSGDPSVPTLSAGAAATAVAGDVELDHQRQDELLGFVQSSTSAAWDASRRIEKALDSAKPGVSYPSTPLAEKLQVMARLIGARLPASIYYVTLDGFDTHAQQPAIHSALLGQWSDALAAFHADLAEMGESERVVTLTFSEFGRRVRENASEGTDHGAAAPVFLTGTSVQPGIHGDHPSLTDLEDGDLRFHTDFRRVYATLLERWLAGDSQRVLGARFEPLSIV
jgi:uncharacterized protein (DUF1501 family)